jgi:alkanesulfonate monooxygenase SsuD/methylene tetrahydromethanopterin reductase-like flavin-dependent oxidoreductase (luciferase family)
MVAPKIGVALPSIGNAVHPTPGDMAATARHAEQLGFESVWVVDQLIIGAGDAVLDSLLALSVAAGATRTVKLGVGVLVLPLRPAVWIAKQAATLQYVSGGRLLLGVGVGGDRHDLSWGAAGVPRSERGRRTDAALRVLPDLIAGRPARLSAATDAPLVRLSPAVDVPPILVGGVADAALARAAEFGDEWYSLLPPEVIAAPRERLAELAAAHGRPTPAITGAMPVVSTDDPSAPDRAGVLRMLTDPEGDYRMPEQVAPTLAAVGSPAEIAERIAAHGRAGAHRVVVSFPAGDWMRQAELLAAARDLLD